LTGAIHYDLFRHALLQRGIHINASGLACWFMCSLTDEDIDRACAAVHEVFAEIA
jgi:glutamate-1-semialdehyde 2,1-aminomutase